MDNSNKTGLTLAILKVLEEYSDADHPLTQLEIARLVNEKYGMNVERRTVASHINLLEDFDYDIAQSKKGCYIAGRLLDPTEISFLVDAIYTSRSISAKESQELCKKLYSCLSKHEQKTYNYIKKSEELNKTDNKETLFFIELINEAINNKQMISFNYSGFNKDGKEVLRMNSYTYHVSPYYLISNGGRYYLLCNYRNSKYNDIQTFRVDYMRNVSIDTLSKRVEIKDLGNNFDDFSITKYINEHIYPFGGESIKAKLLLKDEYSIQYIKDWFGKNCKISCVDGNILADITCNKNALFYWCMQYSGCVEVIEPVQLRTEILKEAEDIIRKYK